MSGKGKFLLICFILSVLSLVGGAILLIRSVNDEASDFIGTALLIIGALLLLISVVTAIIGWKRFTKYLYVLTAVASSVDAAYKLILSDDITAGLSSLAFAVLMLAGMVPVFFKKR